MDKARILVVGPTFPSIGGVETFIQTLLSSRLAGKYRLVHIDTTRDRTRLNNLNQITFTSLYYLARQLAAVVVACFCQHPQVIHLPVTSYISFWKGAAFILTGRLFGLEVVAHLHGGSFADYFAVSNRLVQSLIRWVLNRSTIIIALSENWRQIIQNEIKPTTPVRVIVNTVDEMFAQALLQDDKPPPTSSRKKVLFLGRLNKQKGIFDILKAIPLVTQEKPDLHFVIAGPGDPRIVAEMQQVCEQDGISSYVQILGPVMGQDKLDLFLASSIFVLPSCIENFPITILEAMATGLPVITTPVGAIPEIVEAGVNGFLVTPGDYKALAEKIILLARGERLCTEMARANRAKVLQRYTPEAAMTELEKVYDGLLAWHVEKHHERYADRRAGQEGQPSESE